MTGAEAAERYFCTLFGTMPSSLLIAVGPLRHPRYVSSWEDAAAHVVGVIDVYVRMSLLAKVPENGRGTEADAAAITCLWADVDVNGGPRANGGVVDDGARDLDHALELLYAVREPTMVVASGYGAHGYWCLEEPLLLRDEHERAEAKALVRGWQERLRREGVRLGIRRLDAKHDLASVLRPPGSFNGKGADPVPTWVVRNGGPVATTMEAFMPAGEGHRAVRDDGDDVHERQDDQVRELLARHDDLGRLVARRGKAPGDGTGHSWDFALCCRAAEHGYGDEELAALVRHARRLHGEEKAERPDYVERTVAAARGRVGRPPRERSDQDALAELTRLLCVEQVGRSIVGAAIFGHGSGGRAMIAVDDGQTLEFARLGDISKPARLSEELAATVGVVAGFEKLQAIKALALVRQIAVREAEIADEAFAMEVAMIVLQNASVVEFDFADPASRYETWTRLHAHEPEHGIYCSADAYARALLVAQDREDGTRYVRAGWVQEVARRALGPGFGATQVRLLLLRIGWRQPTFRGQVEATSAGQPRIKLGLYQVPGDWEER